MDRVQRQYESMVVMRADITEVVREEIIQKISKKIESLGGKVTGSKIWALDRNLAYPLKARDAEHKRHFKATFWLLNFTISTDALNEIKEIMRLEERILRNMILNYEGKAQVTETAAA